MLEKLTLLAKVLTPTFLVLWGSYVVFVTILNLSIFPPTVKEIWFWCCIVFTIAALIAGFAHYYYFVAGGLHGQLSGELSISQDTDLVFGPIEISGAWMLRVTIPFGSMSAQLIDEDGNEGIDSSSTSGPHPTGIRPGKSDTQSFCFWTKRAHSELRRLVLHVRLEYSPPPGIHTLLLASEPHDGRPVPRKWDLKLHGRCKVTAFPSAPKVEINAGGFLVIELGVKTGSAKSHHTN